MPGENLSAEKMSDTESRTATVGRKRRQNGDSVQVVRESEGSKRQKLDPDANFIALDSDDDANSSSDVSSKESGEVSSTGAKSDSDRRVSKSSDGDAAEVVGSFDLNGDGGGTTGDGKASPKQQGPPYLDLEAIYPPAMQTWVEQQMRGTSQTPEDILRQAANSKEKGQAYGRASKNFLRQWNRGFRRIFPDCSFLELQRVVERPEAFRRPFDISSLRQGRDDQLINLLKQTPQKKRHELPQFVLLGWIRDMKMHTPASKAMRNYVDDNLLPQWTPINMAPPNRPGYKSAQIVADSSSGSSASLSHAQEQATQPASDSGSDSDSDSASGSEASYSISASLDPNALQLRNISSRDQIFQARYFNITSPTALIRCTSCAAPGHQPATCPALICAHCHSRSHLTRQCPAHKKCTRCRRRGHSGKTCTRNSVQPGGVGDECDICRRPGHAEEECIGLWTTYDPDADPERRRIPRSEMAVGCYNCGGKGHWGDDCPDLPGFIRVKWDTFSRRNAERYIVGGDEGGKEVAMGERNGGGGGRSMQAHQLAQLADFY